MKRVAQSRRDPGRERPIFGYGVPSDTTSRKTKKMMLQGSPRYSRSVLLVAMLVAAGGCRKGNPQPAPTASAPPVVGQTSNPSLRGDSLPPGIDLGKLDGPKRKVFDEVVGREPSACGKGHSLLYSVKNDGSCRASFYAIRYVARLADAGFSEAEIGEKVKNRFRAARVPYIDVSQAPSTGSPSGRVKIVEFADYECTHCKEAQELMHPILTEYAKDVTLYFKHFPFTQHINALNAARAAAAAQKQGKFWQYHGKIWENSERLTPAVLEGIAKEIGLDFQRWIGDVGAEDIRNHVQMDRTEGVALEIHRTPAIFINGRRYSDEVDLPGLKDWIDEELGR
jgi:protein-disulfide isomerase